MPAPCLSRYGGLQLVSAILLALSVSFNVFFASSWIWARLSKEHGLGCLHEINPGVPRDQKFPIAGWSQKASDAAEAAALFNCSGNGDLYVDTFPTEDLNNMDYPSGSQEMMACECYECFTGPRCADFIENCSANVDSGDPLLFAPFWKENAEESAVLIPGWYRMGYQLIEGSDSLFLTPSLEKEIRTLHTLVGNAVIEDKYLVLGVGSSMLVNAAVASLAPNNGTAANVVAAVPYYGAYRSQTELFETSHYTWAGDANIYAEQQSSDNGSSIEFVTSPNNPDCGIRNAVVNGSNAFAIYDLAYYWPHFTAITAARDDDVMLFTLSKITGHAGSRLGWAIVKDYTVYTRLLQHVSTHVIMTSHEPQLRATQLLRSINRAYSEQRYAKENVPLGFPPAYYASKGLSFHYAYATLRLRWKKLSETLETSQRLGLQLLEPSYCNFFKEMTGPSPAYAWVHCKQDNDEDCFASLFQAGIIGRAGSVFGSNDHYTRLSLLKRDCVFDNLVDHLSVMVSEEVSSKPSDPKATLSYQVKQESGSWM